MLYMLFLAFSCLSCTIAKASLPVDGTVIPTGFIGPKVSVSRPRLAITSTGIQPSKTSGFLLFCSLLSNSLSSAVSAVMSAP